MFEEYKRRLLFDALWDNWTGTHARAEAGLCRVARAVEREHYDNHAAKLQKLTEHPVEKETTSYE